MSASPASAQPRFEKIRNFRDYGGYPAADGRRLKTGRLFRTAHHAEATDADLNALKGLGLSVIVDLRRPAERARDPSRRWVPFDAEVIEDDVTAFTHEAPHIRVFADAGTAEGAHEAMCEVYRALPYETPHISLFRRYFEVLAKTDGAVLIHCAAGKDRTGLLAALTHRMLGVGEADLMDNYLATNRLVGIDEERLKHAAGFFFELHGVHIPDHSLRRLMSVDEAYLQNAFDAIAERSGSLEAYFSDTLGVPDDARDRIAARLLS